MTLLPRSLLLVPALLLAPLSASAAAPYPPYCDYKCTSQTTCDTVCWDFDRTFITCGEAGLCDGLVAQPSEPQSSVQPAPAQADDAEAVCRTPADQAQG
ncbi:hypothetical protein COCOR_03947 [Corallococcus coralloides DSM 2259]|uniref:Lipoprotein n=1 Tax=Corallococcus coralloides (strain ATCC 25202 / DSM 2259 / NBRC 100086 / M2) TaxID=1144275 RepID=H8MU36_CORCM|nr:hypothetical protein [Corallococcus coralloides]AFE05525.1 hypothetical protein COCOR_03947 [Corallococcus coralloides DSM 2259]